MRCKDDAVCLRICFCVFVYILSVLFHNLINVVAVAVAVAAVSCAGSIFW